MKGIAYLLVFSFICLGGPIAQGAPIDPSLELTLQSMGPDDEVAVIVRLADKADLNPFKNELKAVRRSKMIEALKQKAEAGQPPLIALVRSQGAKRVQPFWLFNGFAMTAKAPLVRRLAAMPTVESISLDGTIELEPQPMEATSSYPEWNIGMIRAPELWNEGYRGAGAVVATMDTGVDVSHPDLAAKYRGGSNSWYDPNGEHSTPYDKSGHGTQVMGILVGGDSSGKAIGVAPEAKWVAVKIFNDSGVASYSAIHLGFQWLLDPDGTSATDDAPDVVNNSWGFDQQANQCITDFEPDVEVLGTADIAVVFSAGNKGPDPDTSVSPANYANSFAVGAIDQTSSVADSSSRGPSACTGLLFPQVVAPGVSVRTSDLTSGGVFPNSYASVSGTSFAAPHVAGAMALLLSADFCGTVDDFEGALVDSAVDKGPVGPDNTYGSGQIDVQEAFMLLTATHLKGTDADGDGFYAEANCRGAQDCNDSNASIHPGAVEVKHDGIDQDCNGYDLTIDIVDATYASKKGTLTVKATSGLGKNAGLTLVGYGPMKWNARTGKWEISVRGVGSPPSSVTVAGIEGAETVEMQR
jgi:bacillopeptidase F